MKIAIVGSRNYPHLERVWEYVQTLPPDTVIISGGARGVDRTAEAAARKRGLPVMIFAAEWGKYGKAAGMIRNEYIVAVADQIIAFYDGTSRGTANTIDRARKAGKPVEVIPL